MSTVSFEVLSSIGGSSGFIFRSLLCKGNDNNGCKDFGIHEVLLLLLLLLTSDAFGVVPGVGIPMLPFLLLLFDGVDESGAIG